MSFDTRFDDAFDAPAQETTALNVLITKLEAATFGNYFLDAQIARALGVKSLGKQSVLIDPFGKSDHRVERDTYLAYTTSLDAALTLVPADCDWLLNRRGRYACVWESKETGRYGSWETTGASTMPLALCIAAIRARNASS